MRLFCSLQCMNASVSPLTSLQYKMEAKFLEIYNETIRDLLSSNSKQSVDIKIDPNHQGEVYVTNVTPFVVTSQEQVQYIRVICSLVQPLYMYIFCEPITRFFFFFFLPITCAWVA